MAQIVVIGLGRFGFHVARELHAQGHEVLAIDSDPEVVQRIRNHASRALVLDARDTERLDALDLPGVDAAVVSLGERVDVSSLVALHLRELGLKRIVTKAGSEEHGKLLRLIGVDEVIFPEREAAERLALRLSRSNLLEHLELGEDYSVEELAPSEQMVGRTLAELELPSRFDVQVLGTRDALTGTMQFNPGAGYRIRDSDSLLVLGANEQLERLRKL
jgi:trk system potassium uptake protein